MSENAVVVDGQELKAFCSKLFQAEGVPQDEADITADVLVEANLTGMDSHGVSRVAAYMERLRQGGNRKVADIRVLTDFPAGAAWDAQGSLGQVAAFRAMNTAMDKAAQCGVGMVTVKNNNHTGANAYYARMAAKRGMVALIAGNGPPMVAPWGSATAFFSTNPISFGAPAGDEEPIIIDMATSVSARGRIILAAKNGESIPVGWATDKEGNDTTDPKAALEGVLLPFGQHKGYAIAMMVEVLGGLLSGAGCGPFMNEHYNRHDVPVNSGNFFAAIDVARFTPRDEFTKQMDEAIRFIRGGKPRPGVKEIFTPGQIESATRKKRLKEGIALPPAVAGELRREGEKYELKLN